MPKQDCDIESSHKTTGHHISAQLQSIVDGCTNQQNSQQTIDWKIDCFRRRKLWSEISKIRIGLQSINYQPLKERKFI